MADVGIYVRISEDTNLTGLGVARQREDCTALATKKDWTVTEVYEDNDVSATSGRKRPAYERMLGDIREGKLDGVVVWDVDRLTRTPSELEAFIDLANRQSLELASVGGEIDLASPQGRLTARIKGAVARHEVEQSSRRLRRKTQERAEAGLPHGGPPAFGWVRRVSLGSDGRVKRSYDELDPAKAALIREAAERVVAGDALLTIAKDWNERGLVRESARGMGKPWTRMAVRDILLRPRNAGLRQHRGEVIGMGDWQPAIEQELWERACAVLNNPDRFNRPGPRVESLLSGIARCGLCESPVSSVLRGARKTPLRSYVCSGCQKVVRKQVDVDALVETMVLKRLAAANGHELFARRGSDPEVARQAVEVVRGKLAEAAALYADDVIDGSQLRQINERLKPDLMKAEAAYADALAEPDLVDLAGEGILERWDSLSWERKRRVTDYLVSVRIFQTSHVGYQRRVFDPSSVTVEWRV